MLNTTENEPLRIAHVVAYVSTDGSYGGPVSVAVAHLDELANRGHDCVLYAGWDGKAERRSAFRVNLFHAKHLLGKSSFAALYSIRLLWKLWKEVSQFDVVHVHLARDLLTLPAAVVVLLRGTPLVIQTHGMIVPDDRLPARVLDGIVIRSIFNKAKAHIVLTDDEQQAVNKLSPRRSNVVKFDNGVALRDARALWSDDPQVLYCARLHKRKRPVAFVEMAKTLLDRGVNAKFQIAGPDEGEGQAVNEKIQQLKVDEQVQVLGPIDPVNVQKKFLSTQVYVLPSVNEPFPMTVLEAMALGLPSIVTESNGLASALRECAPYLVTDGTSEQLAVAVERLLSTKSEWQDISKKSVELIEQRFSIGAVVSRLESIYSTAITQ